MIDELKTNGRIVAITPDGPKGPLYQVKPGAVIAAKEAGAPIIPLTWDAKPCWHLSTWDKMMLPKPFSTIHVKFGPPVIIPKEGDGAKQENAALLEGALKGL
jgi:hypothetical protein